MTAFALVLLRRFSKCTECLIETTQVVLWPVLSPFRDIITHGRFPDADMNHQSGSSSHFTFNAMSWWSHDFLLVNVVSHCRRILLVGNSKDMWTTFFHPS